LRRWQLGLPHTSTGTFSAISDFNDALDPLDPIQFVGHYMSEAGQNSAMAVVKRTAANLARRLSHHDSP
jgi:hypothetical protein